MAWISAVFLSTVSSVLSGASISKPTLSGQPLSPDEVAVYRAVLRDYMKGSKEVLNLGNLTQPLDPADAACLKGLDTAKAWSKHTVVHRLEASFFGDLKIVLVDAEQQGRAIKKNDPQDLLKKAIDDHENVTDNQLDQSVKRAFQTGLFTLSEIIFDEQRTRAVVSYGFACGTLCGNGNTLILQKVGKNWKVVKRCGGWVS